MTVTQDSFRAAVLDPALPVPAGVLGPSGAPAGARFSVYRNNVVVSLTEALATAFPLLHKLLGAGTFARMAGVYVRAHPPASPLMMFYGGSLPKFLQSFEPLRDIGYLPDCARLDLALRRSYHAADAHAFDPAELDPGDDGLSLHLSLAPASIILRSSWPLFDIWRYNAEPGAPKPRAAAQDVLVARREFDPMPHLLPEGAANWLELLDAGETLGESAERAQQADPAFDLAGALATALSAGALTHRTRKDNR